MIRMVFGLFVFAVLLCAWLVLPPASEWGNRIAAWDATARQGTTDTGTGADVTRAATAAMMTPVDPGLAAGGDAALPDLTEATPAPTAAGLGPDRAALIMASVQANRAPAIRTDDTNLDDTAAAVLAALGMAVAPDQPGQGDMMRDMTQGALSDLLDITGRAEAAAPVPQTALESLVVQALQQGQNDAYIDALLNAAAARGEVTVPDILVTADGRVDTHVLLASIVEEARLAAGGAATPVPTDVTGDGVELRVVQRATETEQYRFYTVAAGDSLGSIAIRFYGSAARYPVIFDANRITLSSPDEIRVGQRLVIPEI